MHTPCSPRRALRCALAAIHICTAAAEHAPQPHMRGCSLFNPWLPIVPFHESDPQKMRVECTTLSGQTARRGSCGLAPRTLHVLTLCWPRVICAAAAMCFQKPGQTCRDANAMCMPYEPYEPCTALSMQGRLCVHGPSCLIVAKTCTTPLALFQKVSKIQTCAVAGQPGAGLTRRQSGYDLHPHRGKQWAGGSTGAPSPTL